MFEHFSFLFVLGVGFINLFWVYVFWKLLVSFSELLLHMRANSSLMPELWPLLAVSQKPD
jgi:hypothetical protein